jgi:LysM repeat protein
VRKGETIARIAARFGVSAAALADANDLPLRARLSPRRMLVIPDREPETFARASHRRAKTEPARASRTRYRVRKGDTLFSIANRHHTTVDKLREWNRLEQDAAIRPGDRLALSGTR